MITSKNECIHKSRLVVIFIFGLWLVSMPLHSQVTDTTKRVVAQDRFAQNRHNKSGNAANLPVESPITLPQTLDTDLDRLIKVWHKGYTTKGKVRSHNRGLPCLDKHDEVPIADSVYIDRLSKLPTVIPITFNPIVKDCIELYVKRRRPLLRSMLTLGDLYYPSIDEEFIKNGLPNELKYLTIVESGLNPLAVSPAGAAGIWQFMPATGKIYGLTINSLVDDRLNPRKSTVAACKYLKDMFAVYKDWLLVIAAYNCGPGNVNRAIRRAGGEVDFWKIYPYLPSETRRYVPLFIGAYYAMHYHREHNICPREMGVPLATDTIVVNKAVELQRIADLSGVSESDLKLLNPQYKRGIVPGNINPYPVLVPMTAVASLEKQRDSLYSPSLDMKLTGPNVASSSTNGGGSKYYTVIKGDTPIKIARKNGITLRQLRRLNGKSLNKLRPGRKVRIR
ncbi:transglycosylase SLT domain-containing protein [Falsiporphyromonas endometrii]|uniref:Transglycosylase SLT domain-containing protein n=2 Tax=Falsiporphyromonas endometrii TaxID=1387297 RepID=A0ABV9K8C0_9PORP